jgi:YhcH/YjgK/YiaL family protein
MIFDTVSNLGRYAGIRGIPEIITFISTHTLADLPEGVTEIQNKDLFARTVTYELKGTDDGHFEAHRWYADLQVIVKGKERIRTARRHDATLVHEYDAEGDYELFSSSNTGNDAILRQDEFALFFPGELHKPACPVDGVDTMITKVIFKIRC